MAPTTGTTSTEQGETKGVLAEVPMFSYTTTGMVAKTMEPYTGKGSPKEYFRQMQRRARYDGWSDEQTLQIIKLSLTKDALAYYDSDTTLETASLDEFIRKFTVKFTPIRLPGEAQMKLSKCFQRHDEDVASYVTRLNCLGRAVLEEDLEDAKENEKEGIKKKYAGLVLNQFRIGLRKELMRQIAPVLLAEENLTMEKAEMIGRRYEMCNAMSFLNISSGQKLMTVDSRRGCSYCKMSNHITANCWKKNRQQQRVPDLQYYRGDNRNFGRDQGNSNDRRNQHVQEKFYHQNKRNLQFSRPNHYRNQNTNNRRGGYTNGNNNLQDYRSNGDNSKRWQYRGDNQKYATSQGYQRSQIQETNSNQQQNLNFNRPSTTTRVEGL